MRRTAKAVARATMKFAMAEAAALGAMAAVGKDAGPVVGWLVGGVAKTLAIVSEEADTRSWRTLPDEIHMARVWVDPGEYDLELGPRTWGQAPIGRPRAYHLSVKAGQNRLLVQRVLD